MSSQPLRLAGCMAPARAKNIAHTDARAQRIARVLNRYSRSLQPALRVLAARHPYLADLTVSFPALAVALARPRHGFCPDAVIMAVMAGLPLLALAEQAGVPLWLRKLPPEAFDGALPELPRGVDFARRILNHLPRRPAKARLWLEAVALAVEWADAEFALWIARIFAAETQLVKNIDNRQLRRLALWAFFSGQPGTRAASLIEQPFNSAMGLKAARSAAGTWFDAVDLVLNLGDGPLEDMWLAPGRVGGFDFVPLVTAIDVLMEARVMGNCLRTYGRALAHNASRLWGIRKDGKRVATLRLSRGHREPLPNLYELEFPRNVVASPEIWWVAHQWLRMHDLTKVRFTCIPWGYAPVDAEAWRQMWRPWWIAKKCLPASLPLSPSRAALNGL